MGPSSTPNWFARAKSWVAAPLALDNGFEVAVGGGGRGGRGKQGGYCLRVGEVGKVGLAIGDYGDYGEERGGDGGVLNGDLTVNEWLLLLFLNIAR